MVAVAVDKSSDDGANCDDGVNVADCLRSKINAKRKLITLYRFEMSPERLWF